MDPTQTLRQLRAAIAEERAERYEYNVDRYEEIMTLFESLDEWMTSGGFKPDQWANRP